MERRKIMMIDTQKICKRTKHITQRNKWRRKERTDRQVDLLIYFFLVVVQ